jgi:regulator of protease activity HflC (stomatin/prohibitin superfamily)
MFVFTVMVTFTLSKATKIAAEGERFAIFTLGRFHSYAGPGLVMIIPYTQQAITLKIGDLGQLKSREFATFGNVNIPVTDTASLNIGQAVRIDGFDGVQPRLVASAVRPMNHCPKCGHEY